MNAVIPFAFEEHLVRAVKRGDEPWFVGKDVCRVLGIEKHHQALEALEDDERGTCIIGTPSGEQVMIIVSEPGVYQLVFRSRKPQAHRFRRWLSHEVIPSIRKNGHYSPGGGDQAPKPEVRRLEPTTYSEALDTVREIRFTAGREAARLAWNRLGLPALPVVPPTLKDEARECLRHLLEAEISIEGAIMTIGTAIDWAQRDDERYAMELEEHGIRLFREIDAVFVANSHPKLEAIFKGTNWFSWHRVLRRLPGASASSAVKICGKAHRGTVIPATELDVGHDAGARSAAA